MKFQPGTAGKRAKTLLAHGLQEQRVMKLFTGCLAAGLLVGAAGVQAQVLAPYEVGRSPYRPASDIGGPYAAAPPEVVAPRYGYGPTLLPATEVYTVLRESGFSPLGIPRLRGYVYTISVIDRGGEDGRLVIDARTGRILRFVPAYRTGDNFHDDLSGVYGPPGAPPPPAHVVAGPPKALPRVASRSAVPIPKANPLTARSAAPQPAQQSAAPRPKPAEVQAVAPQPKPAEVQAVAPQPKPAEVQAVAPQPTPAEVQAAAPLSKPAEAQAPAPQPKSAEAQAAAAQAVTTGAVPAKPAPQVAPTQEMPKVQGLE
jgi:hypothetical protein